MNGRLEGGGLVHSAGALDSPAAAQSEQVRSAHLWGCRLQAPQRTRRLQLIQSFFVGASLFESSCAIETLREGGGREKQNSVISQFARGVRLARGQVASFTQI